MGAMPTALLPQRLMLLAGFGPLLALGAAPCVDEHAHALQLATSNGDEGVAELLREPATLAAFRRLMRARAALFADDALVLLGRAQLASINDAGSYSIPLSELAALPRLKSLLKNQDGEALIRAALEDSELVSISDACVERPLAQDLVQQYDAQLRRHVSYLFSDDGLQSCPPGKLRSMLDEDENTLFLPLASVVDIKKIKELLKNEADKVEACRAAIDAAEPGTLICRVEDHDQGPRVVRTQVLPDEIWECVLLCLLLRVWRRDGVPAPSR